MDDSVESLSDNQKKMTDELRRSLEATQATNQAQLDALKGYLGEVRTSVEASELRSRGELEAIASSLRGELSAQESKLRGYSSESESRLSDSIKDAKESAERIAAGVRTDLTALLDGKTDKLSQEFREGLRTQSSTVDEKLAQVDGTLQRTRESLSSTENALRKEILTSASVSEKRIASTEVELRRVSMSTEFMKGSMEKRMSTLQKEQKAAADGLEQRLGSLDSSVEGRVEAVLEQRSFRTRIRKAASAVWAVTTRGVQTSANALKSGTAAVGSAVGSGARNFKNLAGAGVSKAKGLLQGDDGSDKGSDGPDDGGEGGDTRANGESDKRPNNGDSVSEITFSDDLPTALQ